MGLTQMTILSLRFRVALQSGFILNIKRQGLGEDLLPTLCSGVVSTLDDVQQSRRRGLKMMAYSSASPTTHITEELIP